MPIHKIVIPAEPISPVTRQQLEARRAAARRQVKFATAAWHAAEQAMLTEQRTYDVLDWLLRAGPGHVFSVAIITEHNVVLPRCRYCRARANSAVAQWSCEGDVHRCPRPVRPRASAPPVRVGQQDEALCGLPGEMNVDFTGWTCRGGHATDQSHAEDEVRHALACPIAPACPWPELIGPSELGF
jgi:hypothetical protein